MSTATDPTPALDVRSAAQSITDSQDLSIYRLLQLQARRTPDAIAIAARGRTPLTYGGLIIQVEGVVRTLHSMGVGRNDRVAVVLPRGPEKAVALLAVAASATCAPLNPAYQASEFDFYLTDLKAKMLIVQSGMDSPVIAVAQKRGIPVTQLSSVPEAEAGVFRLASEERSHPECGRFAQSADIALVLHTSGTTSKPKLVPLTQANVCASAHNIVAALELSSDDCCLNVMPFFHIHGLMVILSSLAAGGSVVCPSDSNLSEFFTCVKEFHPTWYTASPTIHQAILVQAKWNRDVINRCPLRFIRSSSSPLPPKVMAELEGVFHAPVIEAYAMTEASHQMSSNPLPPGKRKAGSVGVAAGPDIAIMDDAGNILPCNKTGEIIIRGSNVMGGYENNPAANAVSFTRGWFRTGDVGHLDAQGYLFITGRIKEIINRGGEKISPREIDEVLLEHPAVSEAVTFAVPHITLGEDVAAAVVLRDKASVTGKEIHSFAATRLAEFKIPRRVLIVNEIPKNATGKVQRIGLAEKLGLTGPNQAAREKEAVRIAPRTRAEENLAKIWAQVLGLAMVGIGDNFFDLGGHSLLAMQLFVEIKKTFGKDLPPTTLFQAPTVEQLATILDQDSPSPSWSPLVAIQPKGSKPPFFCVHPIGGSVLWYYDLARHLDPDQPFYGLQAQGLDGKEPLHTRVEEMAARYIKELSTVQPQGPYYLGGLSFGGLVAFEMAQQLHAQGHEVALVALVDTRGAHYAESLLDNRPNNTSLVGKVQWFIQKIDHHFNNLVSLGPKEGLTYVLERVSNIEKATEDKINRKLRKIAYKYYRAIKRPLPPTLQDFKELHRQVARAYVAQVYPGRVTILRAREQPHGSYSDPTIGWEGLVAGVLEIHEVPGNHDTVIEKPHVRVLAEKLKDALRAAQQTANGQKNELYSHQSILKTNWSPVS